MFFNYEDESIRFTGRWNWIGKCVAATAAGSYFEFAYQGKMALMHFDLTSNVEPYPHLWISVDGGAMCEAPLGPFLRVQAKEEGNHIVKVIFKSGVEMQHRWHFPLVCMVGFKGYEADASGVLPEDNRKTIEFVGDSITEGVLIDAREDINKFYSVENHNRVNQDDVCATYAWLTAEALNLRPLMMGYGAVGVTRIGQGAVPRVQEAYPYTFFNHEVKYPSPDYIVINHGTNDASAPTEEYTKHYRELLDVIIKRNPTSKIFAMGIFYDVHTEALEKLIGEYNKENNTDITFISTAGWLPKLPVHPLREGHLIAAKNLTRELKKLI